MTPRRAWPAALALLAPLLAACAGDFGAGRLLSDQVSYSTALSRSQNAQTLLNIIRIRYGDSPVFLNATQIIAGYQLQRNLTGGLTLAPGDLADAVLAPGGSIQLQQSPTFTLEPVTGDALARSIIRPLSPEELLPLSLSSLPVDTLFRLAVQSVNGIQNSQMVASVSRPGSARFYRLLRDLRRLQMADHLGVRFEADAGSHGRRRLVLAIVDSADPDLQGVVRDTRALLGMGPASATAEVVYGSAAPGPGEIAILTRPILGVLRQVASEAEVPAADVAAGLTVPTVRDGSAASRPAVVIHAGTPPPGGAFAQVTYRGRCFWIAENDFDSKAAYSVVQLLLTLAQSMPSAGALLAIPTR